MSILCGTGYRTKINDEPVEREVEFTFGVDEVKVVTYCDFKQVTFFQGMTKKLHTVELTNTNYKALLYLKDVRTQVVYEDVVKTTLIFWYPERIKNSL